MSGVIAVPELMAQAATDLAGIGSNVSAAHLVAAAPTVSVLPAAADEVSAGIAHLFSQHAQDYQGLAGQAAAFHDQFVQHLTASAGAYASAEAANVTSLLQPLTAIAPPVAAAVTAAQSTWNDLETNIIFLVQDLVTVAIFLALSPIIIPLFALFLIAIFYYLPVFLVLLNAP